MAQGTEVAHYSDKELHELLDKITDKLLQPDLDRRTVDRLEEDFLLIEDEITRRAKAQP